MIPGILHTFAAACNKGQTFFGLPVWYKYLKIDNPPVDALGGCRLRIDNTNDYLLIALAGVDILLRVAGLVAVGFVVWGGIRYVLSQGEPENTKNALSTILNALIGVAITVVAAAFVSFIGKRLGG